MLFWLYIPGKRWYNYLEWLGKEEGFSLIQAVIFELNGVLVDVDLCHRRAWKRMAKEQGLPFDDRLYARMQGMDAQQGLDCMLGKARRNYSLGEKWALSARNHDLYSEQITLLTRDQMLPGAMDTLNALKAQGIKLAAEGPDENMKGILRQLKLLDLMDAVVDDSQITRKKPDPQSLLLTAQKLSLSPEQCLAVVDSLPGAEAAEKIGMKVAAIGNAADCSVADICAETLQEIDLAALIAAGNI